MQISRSILVTGGAGFIGSAIIRFLIKETDYMVINLDALTYAGNIGTVSKIAKSQRYRFVHGDIRDRELLEKVFREHRPDAVMHLAAESHVDRSIADPSAFIETNIIGTYNLLEVARTYWKELPDSERNKFRFHHVSTDEVYGSLGSEGAFTESSPYMPNSPYSASKASADHLVRAWHHTYGLPVVTSNCSNNYGPYQLPEKLIPFMVLNAVNGKPLPVYGTGDNSRDWLYVEDHVHALLLVMEHGRIGETYNIGGLTEKSNIEVVQSICAILDLIQPDTEGPYERLITFVKDRPGHDLRYAINASKIETELGWRPKESFETGLEKTVRWYLENPAWVKCIQTGNYYDWLNTNYGNRLSIP